jgi:hypothetical protein
LEHFQNGQPGNNISSSEELRLRFNFTPQELDLGAHTAYVEAEYRTGVILSDGSPEIHHTKIKIIAEVISDDFGLQ